MVKVEKVFSTVKNEGKDLINAPFWKDCYHENEVTKEMKKNGKQWYCYHVKFDGLKPVMLNKTDKLEKFIK